MSLPARVCLPSGKEVKLSHKRARRAIEAATADPSRATSIAGAFDVLAGPGVVTGADGAPLAFGDLSLEDAHTLRAVLLRAGVLPEEEGEFRCDNCDVPFRCAPSKRWEWAPFLDGELDDAELDRPFEFDRDLPVTPMRVGARVVRTMRLSPRTVGEAEPLWRSRGALRLTPAIVAAMGIKRLGTERRATVLAEALADASDDAWSSVVDGFLAAHYPPRLSARVRCASCGADQELDVPLARELGRGSRGATRGRPFVDLDAFEVMVKEAAALVYRRRGVKNIGLYVDAGVPQCDDGGVPLLGCYTPGGEDPDLGIPQTPEIRLFYRTFESEFTTSDDFDLAAEIHETIDHEVTHHLHFLSGHDPLDEEERAEIVEEERRLVGRREHQRRAWTAFFEDLGGFLRVAWPLLVIGLLVTVLSRWF